MSFGAACAVSFLSGFIALSYEILWYRVFSFASRGVAPTFPLLLGAYLTGIALGAFLVRKSCVEGAAAARSGTLARLFLGSQLLAYLAVPAILRLVVRISAWTALLPVVGVATVFLGATFPLVAHAAVAADDRAGARIASLNMANIAGSAGGTLLTGFLLMDRCSLGELSTVLGLLGLLASALVLAPLRPLRRLVLTGAGLSAFALPLLLAPDALFQEPYERLFYKEAYGPEKRFAHVVATRSGVVTVTTEGITYGGGIYDGAINTDPCRKINDISRAYAVAGFHRGPKEVLVIGLSTGAWASVIVNLPGVERLTAVEINPAYLEVIRAYPEVAPLLQDPRVSIEIDDGRRWLRRNPERRFDFILSNVSFHWRSNASNVLSREFLEMIRQHLHPGGVYFFNPTGSTRAINTALTVFPHGLGIMGFVAVSDSPLAFDAERWRRSLQEFRLWDRRLFDPAVPEDVASVNRIVEAMRPLVRPDAALRPSVRNAGLITDDNMGEEWTYRLHP